MSIFVGMASEIGGQHFRNESEEMRSLELPEFIRNIGFDCYAYLYVQPRRIHAVSNYPAESQKQYLVADM